MTLNNECVRDLLLWVEKNQTLDSAGKPNPIHLKRIYSEFLYSQSDINTAAQYLVEKKILKLPEGRTTSGLAPRAYVFCGITALGYDYIAAVKDDTIWKKIKSRLGAVTLASVPAVIELSSKLL